MESKYSHLVKLNTSLLDSMEAKAAESLKSVPRVEGDFERNGILYCGKCRTPKRELIPFNGKQLLWATECRCVQQEMERQKREEEEKQRRLERLNRVKELKQNSLLDPKFSNATFKVFEENSYNSKNLQTAKRYCEKFVQLLAKNQGLLFYGDNGTGKSFTAACIANDIIERYQYSVIITTTANIADSSFAKSTEKYEWFMQLSREADLLVIDDFGAERNTEFVMERIFDFVDSRYKAAKPVIITTNLSLTEMINETDRRKKRIYDRIFEMCYPMEFKGPSWRQKISGKRINEINDLLGDNDG